MSNSIKKEAQKIIRKNNPHLFGAGRDKFLGFVNDHSKWYVPVSVVLIIFFALHLIEVPCLNVVPIEEGSVKNLITNRTANVVTMISVTFAIIGFLIANLAIKESFTYNLLFKKSHFFPVVFIALTVIVCFLILSTLGDWLPLEYQSDALLVGTYLIIAVVFLIGFLFTRLVRFTNQKHLLSLIKRELLSESKRNLILAGKRIISSEEVSKLGLPLHSMAFLRQTTKGDFTLPEGKNTISDIKINSLRNRVAAIQDKGSIFIKNVFLGRKIIGQEDGFFFVEEGNYPRLKKVIANLNKTIITTKSEATPSEAKEYVLQKLEESIAKNDDKLVGNYLDMIVDVYSLQQTFKV